MSEEQMTRTPEQEQQFLKALLTAMAANIDAWVEQQEQVSGDRQQAVNATRMKVQQLIEAIQTYHTQVTEAPAMTLEAASPMGNPQACYDAYYACLARQGTNCAQQLQICLGGK